MKIKWGIPICLLLILLILGFFARAEIQQHFSGSKIELEEKTIFTGGQVDVYFDENRVIHSLPISAYSKMAIIPDDVDWQKQTLDPIVEFMKLNNEKVLKITGYFLTDESEVQLGGYENLGMARAGLLKQELIAAGISSPRILINSSAKDTQTLKIIFSFEYSNDSLKIP